MATSRREELNRILAMAAAEGIPVPADVILEIVKQDTSVLIAISEQGIKALLDAGLVQVRKEIANLYIPDIPEFWNARAIDGMISPDQLPLYTLTRPGAVPPPRKPNLVLGSRGWEPMPYSGGGRIIQTGGSNLPANAVGWLHNDGAGNLVWSTPAGGTPDHALLTHLDYASANHTGFPGLAVANLFTQDNRGTEFIGTRSGTITHDVNGRVTQVVMTGGRTITITRDINGYILSAADGTNTWTMTRDINNVITAWNVT